MMHLVRPTMFFLRLLNPPAFVWSWVHGLVLTICQIK